MVSLESIIKKYIYSNEKGYIVGLKINQLYQFLDEIICQEEIDVKEYLRIELFYQYRSLNLDGLTDCDEGYFIIIFGEKKTQAEYEESLVLKDVYLMNPPLAKEELKILRPNGVGSSKDFIDAIKKYKRYLPTLLGKVFEEEIRKRDLDTDEKKALGYFEFNICGR